jgi:hypothetical protein
MKSILWVVLVLTSLVSFADEENAKEEKPNCTLKVQVMNLKTGKKKFEMKEFHVFNQKECKELAKQHTTTDDEVATRASSSFRPR